MNGQIRCGPLCLSACLFGGKESPCDTTRDKEDSQGCRLSSESGGTWRKKAIHDRRLKEDHHVYGAAKQGLALGKVPVTSGTLHVPGRRMLNVHKFNSRNLVVQLLLQSPVAYLTEWHQWPLPPLRQIACCTHNRCKMGHFSEAASLTVPLNGKRPSMLGD